MRRLVADIATEMSLAAAQQGMEIHPVSLYKHINDALIEAEQVLHPTTIESITARQWAVLISHAKRNKVQVRDVLMQITLQGMDNVVSLINKIKTSKPPVVKGGRRTHLRLIK
jgi:hypothetical protein